MTFAEHLIENALVTIESGNGYGVFASSVNNQDMAKGLGIELYDVWDMAQYVMYIWKDFMMRQQCKQCNFGD